MLIKIFVSIYKYLVYLSMSNDITHRAFFDIPPPKSEAQLFFEKMMDLNKHFENPFTKKDGEFNIKTDPGQLKFICENKVPLTINKP